MLLLVLGPAFPGRGGRRAGQGVGAPAQSPGEHVWLLLSSTPVPWRHHSGAPLSPVTGLMAHRKSFFMPNPASLLPQPRPSCSLSALWAGGELLHPFHNNISSTKLSDLPKAPQPLLFSEVASSHLFGLQSPCGEAGRCLLGTVAAVPVISLVWGQDWCTRQPWPSGGSWIIVLGAKDTWLIVLYKVQCFLNDLWWEVYLQVTRKLDGNFIHLLSPKNVRWTCADHSTHITMYNSHHPQAGTFFPNPFNRWGSWDLTEVKYLVIDWISKSVAEPGSKPILSCLKAWALNSSWGTPSHPLAKKYRLTVHVRNCVDFSLFSPFP